ncbi:hypothetical protein BDN72DRAFT_902095 [Pluteus cervinus]|uniref:Uncharacterized protein n=1 Tax=Pluteus cervinus TaxID=181527 RepID=A0ACD3AE62_9AGAR|nr:hypothetical protein BDN72DRAFT_902095 [Pluteus cervinus]
MSDPLLPPELERLIFIHAFHRRVKEPTNLFLVSKRVREWLLPVAFEVVIVERRRYFPVRFSSYNQFVEYGPHIRHFMLLVKSWFGGVSLDRCLGLCPNITNLSLMWISPNLQLETLRNFSKLTHLSLEASHLLNLVSSTFIHSSPPSIPKYYPLRRLGYSLEPCRNAYRRIWSSSS